MSGVVPRGIRRRFRRQIRRKEAFLLSRVSDDALAKGNFGVKLSGSLKDAPIAFEATGAAASSREGRL